jgi:hypothetical protein
MTENAIRVHLPALPAAGFFNDPDCTILTVDGDSLLSYDPVTRSAFVYSIVAQRWSITAPCDFAFFAGLVAIAGHRLADCDDTRRWMAACGCPVDGPGARALN